MSKSSHRDARLVSVLRCVPKILEFSQGSHIDV